MIVRQRLIERAASIAPEDLADFERRADRVIEPAFHAGMALALAHIDASETRITDAIARSQE